MFHRFKMYLCNSIGPKMPARMTVQASIRKIYKFPSFSGSLANIAFVKPSNVV